MEPRCEHVPAWMCEMCDELEGRPLMSIWTVMASVRAVTVIVPVAVTPGSGFNVNRSVGPADGDGVCVVGLGEGDAVTVPPDSPHAAPARSNRAERANHRLKPALSTHLCSRCYRCRLLDGVAQPTLGKVGRVAPAHRWSGVLRAEPGAAAPDQISEPEQDEDRAQGAKAADDVVDRGHEVVGGGAQGGDESPAVDGRRGRGRAGFEQADRDRAERGVVLEVVDLPPELLDLGGDLAQLVLYGDDVRHRHRLPEQGQHGVALSLCVH